MGTLAPRLVDTLHIRLLVGDFAAAYAFYAEVLPELISASLAEGGADGPYARWDTRVEQPALALLDRASIPELVSETPPPSTHELGIVVIRLADADIAQQVCLDHGAKLVSAAADYPQWGPQTRIAYLRDPVGTLLELQASPG